MSQQTLRKYLKIAYDYARSLQDIRVAGQLAFVVLVLLVSWSGVKAIDANYQLQQQIAELDQQNQVQTLENNNLQLQNTYYNSDQYLELSARQDFGLGQPGETELIVPRSVALSYTVSAPATATPHPQVEPSVYQRNIQAWVDFFLHRSS